MRHIVIAFDGVDEVTFEGGKPHLTVTHAELAFSFSQRFIFACTSSLDAEKAFP